MMTKHKTLYRGRYLGLCEVDGWEYATRTNATGVVVIVAATDEGELVLVEQFRIPVASTVIELPAGLVGDLRDRSEPRLEAARRELLEETGYEAEYMEEIMSCPSSAGMSDEIITFVGARGLRKVSAGGGDNSEDITVHLVPIEAVDQWIARRMEEGTPADPKIFSALHWLAHPDLYQES